MTRFHAFFVIYTATNLVLVACGLMALMNPGELLQSFLFLVY